MSDNENGGQPADNQAHNPPENGGENNYQMPEKFSGKSAEEIAKSYEELEKQLGKRGDYDGRFDKIEKTLTELGQAFTAKKEENEDDGGLDSDEMKKSHFEYIKGFGFATKKDLEEAFDKGRKSYEMERIFDNLESELSGKDGRPKFDRKEISKYALDNNLEGAHPQIIYDQMHKKELIDWHIRQAQKGNYHPKVQEGGKKPALPNEKKTDYSKETEDQRRERLIAQLNAEQNA